MILTKLCLTTICALRFRKIGYALAQKYDRLIFRAITRGARAASPITKTNFVEPGGTQIRVGSTTNASDASIFQPGCRILRRRCCSGRKRCQSLKDVWVS